MTNETEEQRLARLDREATRGSRIRRTLLRDAKYRRREEHAEWLKQHGATPTPSKTDSDKT
jgi:hypothetical protein